MEDELGIQNRTQTLWVTIIGSLLVALVLVITSIVLGRNTSHDTEKAVRSVSLLYLDELAERRKQVVENYLDKKIEDMRVATSLLTENDLSDIPHLQAYQTHMKQLYGLEKFAFVDKEGTIYTALGIQHDIDDYPIDQNLTGPSISVKDVDTRDKKIIIAIPLDGLTLEGKTLTVCFIEITMSRMLDGVSISEMSTDSTFCNLYTSDGIPLTDMILGGLGEENGLYKTLEQATFEPGYSLEKIREDFAKKRAGVISFEYHNIQATLAYVPVAGVDWFLTYLIQESVINDLISPISEGIVTHSLFQSILMALVMLGMFSYLISRLHKNAALLLEKETAQAAERAKRQELEKSLALKEQLLRQEQDRVQRDRMITALAADYLAVYYVDLDKDEGICYQAHTEQEDKGLATGDHFSYLEAFTSYANRNVTENYREEFLAFIDPVAIQEALLSKRVISYRYMVHRHGKDSYESIRFAGVRHLEDRSDNIVHSVGACITNVDQETREALDRNQSLSDALALAAEANKAKTAFLSNMSHEIRTPMNAIIGLDSIALNDPSLSPQTREYLEKIGNSAEHLLSLINDILDMSRIESGRMMLKNEQFSISKLLESVNTLFTAQCQEKGLTYVYQVVGHLDNFYIGDNMKLRQVLINILGNAVKFTPAGGRVSLTVERTARFEGKSTLSFTIKDTGIGMSEEFIPHIFDTFSQEDSSTTSKYGSSGLGMAITKNIVEMMNGYITLESKKGEGTTFYVTVTLLDSHHQEQEEEGDIEPSKMQVLIIDDDPVAREHAKLVLESEGVSSDTAASGAEALEMVRLRQARRNPYNLYLVDWKMPDMDGLVTSAAIRKIVGDNSAIIFLTAYRWDDIQDEAMAAGVDNFLSKPLFANHILELFSDAIKKKASLGGKKKADLQGKRILLAEDIAVNAEIIMLINEMRGMTTDLAKNGKEAVEMFEKEPPGTYAAILMDMRMPEMDGLEATRTIRSLPRHDAATIPIIALTANAFDEDVQRSLQAGLNAHLTKPVQPEALYETLEGLIED